MGYVVNPHVGANFDEITARAVIGSKMYFGINRGTSIDANGYEYSFTGGVATAIDTKSGKGQWVSVYDSSRSKIYFGGQNYNGANLALYTGIIDPSNDAVTNIEVPNTGDCNELTTMYDDDTQIVAGERIGGGTTTGSSYPNGGGLWTMPKATFATPASYTRVYEDASARQWSGLTKRGSTYYNMLNDLAGAWAIQTSTNLTAWSAGQSNSPALAFNTTCGICYHTALDLVIAAVIGASNHIFLYIYNGSSWSNFDSGIAASAATTVYVTPIIYDATRILLFVGKGFGDAADTHDVYLVSTLTGTPTYTQRGKDYVGTAGNAEYRLNGTTVVYGSQYPAYLLSYAVD